MRLHLPVVPLISLLLPHLMVVASALGAHIHILYEQWTNHVSWSLLPLDYFRFSQVQMERRSAPIARPSAAGGQQQGRPRMPFRDDAPRSRAPASAPRRNNNNNNRNQPQQNVSRRGGNAVGAVRKPRGRNDRMMDIDQGPSGRPVGRFPMTTSAGRGNGRGRNTGNARNSVAPASERGGRKSARGRGGARRGGRGGEKKTPATRENLDADLENYMMRDSNTAKVTLDTDLENYMMGVTDLPAQIGA